MTGALLLAALYPVAAAAQDVTSSNTGFGALRRGGDAAAEEQGRSDWPRITEGEDGTHVHVTFDPHNVDVVLMTPREYGLSRLLDESQRLAKAIHRPEADFITFMGQKTVTVDVELNDYLQHPSRGRTEVELDLSALAVALKSSRLPRPIMLHIEPDSADRAVITSGSSASNLRDGTILGLDEVAKGSSVLRFESQIPWYAPIIAGGMAVMMAGGIAMCMWLPWRVARQRREQALLAAAGGAAEEADPAEVQKQYDKQPALWWMVALLPILLLATALFGDPRRVLESAFYVFPDSVTRLATQFLPLGLLAGFGGSTLLCRLVERTRATREGLSLAPPPDPDAPPAWTQQWWLALLGLMMLVMMGMMTLLFSGLARPTWLVYIPYGALGVMLVGGVVGSWLSARAVRRTLATGDPWHDLVQEIAAAAGVRVKRVVRIQSTSVNACATAFGTVGLTSALLRKMEPDEIRAVIAHEVGHLRGGHARRNLVLTLGGSILVLALWWGLVSLAEGRISRSGLTILRGPIFSIFLLPIVMNLILGKERRRHEEVADRFAVDVTGDPELVIRMLTRLHTLESSPQQLKRSDEAISTHPSLVNRIAAIRSYATEREGRSA